MTTGQRIAEKRKELGLSQEALGQELSVSRQSVYKWESDAALPDIDKLVALSRRFGVTVGWLLGVEEPTSGESASPDPAPPAQDPQLVAEQIAKAYLEARPGMSRTRRRLLKLSVCAAALCLCFGMWRITDRLEQMESRYDSLMHSVINLNSNVSSQISGITQRVEQAVKGQNEIAADYSATLDSVDIPGNSATFSAMALPKEEASDLQVWFTADHGGQEPVTVPGTRQSDGTWRAQVTCPLTNSIQLSVIFESGGTLKNQRLEHFPNLYRGTFPTLYPESTSLFIFKDLSGEDLNVLTYEEDYAYIRPESRTEKDVAEIRQLRLGFFKNRKLVCWLEPIEGPPPRWQGFSKDNLYFKLSNIHMTLEESDVLCLAVVITDEYGRDRVIPDMYYRMGEIDKWGRELTYADQVYKERLPDDWEY